MNSIQGKKGILGWLTRHPLLAVLGVIFFVLVIAVAVALAVAAFSTPVETIYPRKSKKRPVIAGASELIPATATVLAPPVAGSATLSKWQLFLIQAALVIAGSAFTIYVTFVLTGNF